MYVIFFVFLIYKIAQEYEFQNIQIWKITCLLPLQFPNILCAQFVQDGFWECFILISFISKLNESLISLFAEVESSIQIAIK